ncbi:hypothetical protein RI054_03g14220 [Pseudoscourfieldia marina]
MTSYALESTLFVQRVEAFLSLHGPTANGRLGQAVPLPASLRTRGMSYMKILQEASNIRIETSTAHYNGNAARARVGWTAHLRTSDPLTTHNRELGSSGALPAQNQTTPTVGGADCVRTVRRVVRNGNAPNVSEEDPAHLGKRRRDESGDGQGEAGPSTAAGAGAGAGFKDTPGQQEIVKKLTENKALRLLCVLGPAGSGKTYIALREALRRLNANETKRIICIRPAVTAGEELGHLPGDLNDKLSPFMAPVYDNCTMLGMSKHDLDGMVKSKKIELCSIAHARGRTFADCVVIADEMQNATMRQLELVATRIGNNCTMVLLGDPNQSDVVDEGHDANEAPRAVIEEFASKLMERRNILQQTNFDVVNLSEVDVMRDEVLKSLNEIFVDMKEETRSAKRARTS